MQLQNRQSGQEQLQHWHCCLDLGAKLAVKLCDGTAQCDF